MKRVRSLLAAALVLAAAGCSTATAPDEIGLKYDSSPVTATSFDTCVSPAERQWHDPFDDTFVYPGGQRTFAFGSGDDTEMAAATVVSADDLELTVTGLVTFGLNMECDVFQQFHERLGLKYEGFTDEGWVALLRDYIGQPLNRALDDATKEFDWRDLYTSAEEKAEWEDMVGELTAQYISEQGGGAYFCSPVFTGGEDEECGNPQLTIQQPVPPEDVRAALIAAQEAVEMTTAQESENDRVEAEMEAIEMLVDALGPEGAVLWEAMRRGDIDLVPVPVDGGMIVAPSD